MTKTVATKTTKVNSSEIGQIGHNGLGHENKQFEPIGYDEFKLKKVKE